MISNDRFLVILDLVRAFVSAEGGRGPAEISEMLLRSGWEVDRQTAAPYPDSLQRAGVKLGILSKYGNFGSVVLLVVIDSLEGDWSATESSSKYVRDVIAGYPEQIGDAQDLGRRLTEEISAHYPVVREGVVLDEEVTAFVSSEAWRIGDAHAILGVEHLDPDDTPIEVNLYLYR